MNYKMEYGEKEINLIHLLCYFLERYKSLFVVVILSAVFSLGVSIFMPQKESSNVDISSYKPAEGMAEIMDVAFQYRMLYEQQEEYNKNSLIMQMDHNAVYKGKLIYHIDYLGNKNRLSALYANVIADDSFLEKAAMDNKITPAYLKEVLGVEWNADRPEEIIYTVAHFDKSACENLLLNLEESIEEYHKKLISERIVHSINKIITSVSVGAYPEYLEKQYNYTKRLSSCKNQKETFEAKITGMDLLYYQYHYLNQEIDNVSASNENNTSRWMGMGIVLAFFLWAMFWGCRYLFDNRIHTKEEVETYFNLPIIGHIKVEDKKRIYCNWKKYTFDTEKYIKYTLETLEENGVVVSGYCKDDLFNTKNVYYINEYLWNDSQNIIKAKEVGHVVIGIKLEQASYEEVEREIEMCNIHDVKIVGVLVLE